MDNIYFYCSMENISGSLGGQGSEGNPFFGYDQWAYRFATSGSNFDDTNLHQVLLLHYLKLWIFFYIYIFVMCNFIWSSIQLYPSYPNPINGDP
jgi:hypothetical protein